MRQEKFFIATSTKIPKKGEKYECRRFTTNPNIPIDCFIGKIHFVLKLRSSNNIYVIVDGEGRIYFLQVQKN